MTTHRHIALLRGINVGKAKRVAMADLRSLVEDLSCSNVRTLLNSGNVVFDCPSKGIATIAARIEKALIARTGVQSRVTVIDADALASTVAKNPFAKVATDPSRFLVAVLNDPSARTQLRELTKQKWDPERFALGEGVAYLWCANGILESKAATAMNKLLGDRVTTRNWATVMKLDAMAREQSSK